MAPSPDRADVELLERARAGDRAAFGALVAFWGRPALDLAFAFAADARTAHAITREAFLTVWHALPSMHSQRPFRPMLLGALAKASASRGRTEGPSPLRQRLNEMPDDARAVALLSAFGYPHAEIALALTMPLVRVVKLTREAKKALGAVSPDAGAELASASRTVALAPGFFEEGLMPALTEQVELVIRRLVSAGPVDAWRALTDPGSVGAWIGEQARIRPQAPLSAGSRVSSIGVFVGKKRSRDEHIVTRVQNESLLCWTTSVRPGGRAATIEQHWSVAIQASPSGCELIHRLHGHGFPPGLPGRRLRKLYAKAAEAVPGTMHRRLERIAAAAEAAARGATL